MFDSDHECRGFTSPEEKPAQVNIRKATCALMLYKHLFFKNRLGVAQGGKSGNRRVEEINLNLNQTPAVQIPNKHPPTIILGR
jgi:hypothetical protein